jgi:hypothetical protein
MKRFIEGARYHAAKTHSSPSCPPALPVAATALASISD